MISPPVAIAPPITKESILNKLCFVVFGKAFDVAKGELKIALNEFNKSKLGTSFAHQIIGNWCDKGEHPSKPSSFVFIQKYLESAVTVSALNPDQKGVYKQILHFCIDNSVRTNKRIYNEKDGRVVIRTRKHDDDKVLIDRLPGAYLTYRMRFGEDIPDPIAQEVLIILEEQGRLQFEHWIKRENDKPIKFEGSVLLVGNILWFFGATTSTPERLRIMHFRHIRSKNAIYNALRWGLLATDVPEDSKLEPVSCRIVIERQSASIQDMNIDSQVKYLKNDDFDEKRKRTILRLIDNNTPAESNTRSFNPVVGDDDKPLVDALLTVDQRTIEAVGKFLYPDKTMGE